MAGTTALVAVLLGGVILGIVHIVAKAKVDVTKIKHKKG